MAFVLPTVTGFSGFWQYHAPAGQTGQYQPRFARSSEEYQASVQMGKRGFRKYRAVARALNGAAPGAVTTDSYRRVVGVQAMNDAQLNGGLRTTVTVSNAVTTTAAMRDFINARIYDNDFIAQAYPRDLGGNGGGGKVGR